MTIVDAAHFFGGICIGMLAGLMLGVLVCLWGLR